MTSDGCLEEGCTREFHARDMCHYQYSRWRKTPSFKRTRIESEFLEDYLESFEELDNGCWAWTRALTTGYGTFRFNESRVNAHVM